MRFSTTDCSQLRGVLAAVLIVGLAAGCAILEQPLRSHFDSASGAVKDCARWFAALDETVDRAGVRDAGAYRIPGFPYLRLDRFSASFRDEVKDNEPAFAAWAARLENLDATARHYELVNLPSEFLAALNVNDKDEAKATTGRCAMLLARNDLASPSSRELLLGRAQVPDDYVDWKRALGLYPLTRIPFFSGVDGWQQRAITMLRQAGTAESGTEKLVRYEPADAALSPEHVASLIARASTDALGIPQFSAAERAALLQSYAPVFEIDTAAEHDRFGALAWNKGPAPEVNFSEPVAYGRVAFTRYRKRTLPQLVYTIWFPERPSESAFDLLAGRLDGLVFRVTIDTRGRPLVYDSMHSCGCFHTFFPTGRVKALPAPQPRIEWAFAPITLPALAPAQRIALRLASRTHYVIDVRPDNRIHEAVYRLADDDDLRALPTSDGGTRSAFGPDGIVQGTERAERFLFWPMGIDNPGAMRQWGRHATAFVGRRHFDDADLIERRFEIMPDDTVP
ncbi:MAG: hypothetical protein HYY77_21835 [Betaproteobacteria bacterium]|nr:hypothetical protein [Betaproteobacteria bacterium]